LAATLMIAAAFSIYSLRQLQGVRQLHSEDIESTRGDSLQLLRLHNALSSLGAAIHAIEGRPSDPLPEDFAQSLRNIASEIREGLREDRGLIMHPGDEDVIAPMRTLSATMEALVESSRSGKTGFDLKRSVIALDASQHALSAAVGGLIQRNIQLELAASSKISQIYDGVERNIYLFMTAMLIAIAAIGLIAAYYDGKIFDRLRTLSEQRSTLARRLIGVQEEVFRSVSRELHDDFGQILTAIGAMLRRVEKQHPNCESCTLTRDVVEIKAVTQEALDKTRSFSQALHPSILDDYGLDRAIERHIAVFHKQTGLSIRVEKSGITPVPEDKAIHIYRILQEALSNISKHARATHATVRLTFEPRALSLDVEDDGVGITAHQNGGLGLVAMRERAELLKASFTVSSGGTGGTMIKLRVPLQETVAND
jgi:signal transduction histidine kinase